MWLDVLLFRDFNKITALTIYALKPFLYTVSPFQRVKSDWTVTWLGISEPDEMCSLIISYQTKPLKDLYLI